MSLIQKEIADFTVQCYQNNAFRAVSKADVLGKWSVFFFYPADFTFVCPTELEDLAALTGKVHTDVEFAEYWSWTDLDTLARLTLAPEPPCVPDLSREELVELVEIIQHCSVTGREWAMRYYTALLRRSLSLPNVMDFVASGEDVEVIAEKLLQAAR